MKKNLPRYATGRKNLIRKRASARTLKWRVLHREKNEKGNLGCFSAIQVCAAPLWTVERNLRQLSRISERIQ